MDKSIKVRFNEKDIDNLREIAESKGLKLSSFIRMKMLEILEEVNDG